MNIPEKINFNSLNRILIAYLKAGSHEKPIDYKEAATRSGIRYTSVSLNNKFFVSSGFLTEESRGRFKLTEKGAKYAQMLDWGRIDESKEALREILKDDGLSKIVVDYVSIAKNVTKENIVTTIALKTGVQKRGRYIIGMNSYIDMLIFSGLIQEEEGKYVVVKDFFKPSPIFSIETPKPMAVERITQAKTPPIPVSITLNIDEKTDLEKIKSIIKAVKETLQE